MAQPRLNLFRGNSAHSGENAGETAVARQGYHTLSHSPALSLASWIAFAVAITFYWLTVDPAVSYWDCPEYVTVASRLEIGHPPGNPIWMLAMRVATIPFPAAYHALVINLSSGLFMAFATFFLCRLIFLPLRVLFFRTRLFPGLSQIWKDAFSSLIAIGGSLCFALCDSAWFSAVEAEVYAMSAFLSALTLWLMMLWWVEPSPGRQKRLLILLAYLTGISLGVHQLNLLLIPVFAVMVFYRLHPGGIKVMAVVACFLISVAAVGILLMAFIPGVLFGAQAFELWSVNSLGAPYHSGVIFFCILIFILILIALTLSDKGMSRLASNLNTAVWMLSFILLGFSSFAMILIRGAAYPPMNQGVPDNIFALSAYIAREQYPSSPLLYGHTPYSRPLFEETFINGEPRYSRYILEKEKPIYRPVRAGGDENFPTPLLHRSGMLSLDDSLRNIEVMENEHGYLLTDYKFHQKLTPELDMWFPRITSRKYADREAYAGWAGMTEESMLKLEVSETIDSLGNFKPRMYFSGSRPAVYSYRPTYWQNLRFFMAYQAYYMYFRYLFWNFIGRQNDYPSMGEIEHGNFIMGIPFIDEKLGTTKDLPPEIGEENPGHNRYFGIPFGFAILGIIFLATGKRWARRYSWLIFLIFMMTGLAIVAYLNQSPGEPRERDYTFLVSYMAFAMWIAAGFTAVAVWLLKSGNKKIAFSFTALFSLGVPALMAAENFDDHDRRGRYEPEFYVSSLVDFEKPALIFSQGDNYSFPLWYATEVLWPTSGHVPIDITYLALHEYVENLNKQGKNGVSTILPPGQMAYGAYVLSRIPNDSVSPPVPVKELLEAFYKAPPDQGAPLLPASRVLIPIHRDSVVVNLKELSGGSSYLPFKQLMLLDMIASRLDSKDSLILFFPHAIDRSFYRGLEPALSESLFGKIYAPLLPDSSVNQILAKGVERELEKLENLKIKDHYVDPVIADRSRRYRGEMWLAARKLLELGDTMLALKTFKVVLEKYPYNKLLPGDFTLADSTFYEGEELLRLIQNLPNSYIDDSLYTHVAELDSIMLSRHQQWLRYYRSLSPSQRTTLSNRSKRLLRKPASHI